MKKTLATVLLSGLMLTGCGSTPAAVVKATPTASATKTAAPVIVTVPNVIDLPLDKATDQLQALGLKVEATDIQDGKTIVAEKNWVVVTQDPTAGVSAAKFSTVKLGVKPIVEPTPTPTPTTAAPVPFVAPVPVAPPAPPAPKVVPAPVAPKAPVVPKAPPAAYYKNCDAARAAGAAPIRAGQPGYGRHLDRDGDGIGCDKG